MGGATAECVEHWDVPEIVESALKYTTLTFRKTFNSSSKRDILHRSKDVIHGIRPVIEGQTQVNAETDKWYLPLNMKFCNSTALRCRSLSEKLSSKSTCAVMIRIIITFTNQMFL